MASSEGSRDSVESVRRASARDAISESAMHHPPSTDRREMLLAGLGSAAALLAGCSGAGPASASRHPAEPPDAKPRSKEDSGEDDVAPAEDLMREHGVLNRILLVYEESIRR